ncbi:hypothetical protein Z043_102082 [Scleropages formosus]|uniref:SH2 domain-containing protein n=1 Tax=Scleropages formosus TaxID=113540 RepID=A0A0N8K2Q8_SCLFO|nr:hypothetical protein Z043_102082 [Scleropages formosus]
MFYSVYYGKMSKEETERVLERYGREGSFLTRDSESEPGSYCLCVRRSFVVHTFRISRSAGGWAIQLPDVLLQNSKLHLLIVSTWFYFTVT